MFNQSASACLHICRAVNRQ